MSKKHSDPRWGGSPLSKNFDPRAPDGSPIRLKITWGPDFSFGVRVTPHPLGTPSDGTRKRKDEIPPPKIQSTFDGRPCPPEFVKELTELRKRGLLDSPMLKAAFIAAAQEIRDELSHEHKVGTETTVQNPAKIDGQKPSK